MEQKKRVCMKVLMRVCCSAVLGACALSHAVSPLLPAPTGITPFHEIAVQYNEKLPALYNDLAPEERIFLYFLYRASLPGNRICADQLNKDANAITDLFYMIICHKNELLAAQQSAINMADFVKQAECYFVYVWSNHCQYFEKEFQENKRTPARLGLTLITPENLITVLKLLSYPAAQETVAALQKSLFDQAYKPTLTVPNSIEASAVNIYADGFTSDDYQKLSISEQAKLNNYFYTVDQGGVRIPRVQAYCVGGHCGAELAVVNYWLNKAWTHAQKYPALFDEHVVKSLEYLISFFQTGDEEFFKKHSIEWLHTASRISYSLGFVEVYKDPKEARGIFQGDATVRSVDLTKLSAVLPTLEQQLPVPQEFKRTDMTKLPNASVGAIAFSCGDLGPLRIVSAYCLPNYGEIRATYGSKQVIYSTGKQLSALINPEGYRTLFFARDRAEWLAQNDPECSMMDDVWDVQVVLHETMGHGSGRYAAHTFVPGDNMTIEGVTYNVGDVLPVNSSNAKEFLAGYYSALEEMRAEIIALYTSLVHLDTCVEFGFLKKWAEKMTKEELIEWIIYGWIHNSVLRRFSTQADGAQEISGDHARADWSISSFLQEKGCFSIVHQPVTYNGQTHIVLAVTNIDVAKTIAAAAELVGIVQRMKSTGDGLGVQALIGGYCKPLRTPEYIAIIKDNFKALMGDLKVSAMLTPMFAPVQDDKTGKMIDVQASWPADVFELAAYQQVHALSTEI